MARGRRISGGIAAACAVAALLWCCGCGMIADKDRIKVAKLRDQYITRGDMFKVLRDMSDEERPTIEKKGDLVNVLRKMINEDVRKHLTGEIEQKFGKPLVPRDQARQRFISLHPEEHYGVLFTNVDPSTLDMTQEQWKSAKEQAEIEIDRVWADMRGNAAVLYRAAEEVKAGKLKVSNEELQSEYDVEKDQLKMPEKIRFLGLRFATSLPDTESQAAGVRRRLDAGESFDKLVEEFLAKDKSYVLDTDITNSGSPMFAGFWMNASGAQPGEIVGPVFFPAYEALSADASGQPVKRVIPDCYIVFRVIEHSAERPMALDEAKTKLLPGILVGKVMDELWRESGAQIYEDKLPDPGMFAKRVGDPITGRK